jgi:hypothetical protein
MSRRRRRWRARDQLQSRTRAGRSCLSGPGCPPPRCEEAGSVRQAAVGVGAASARPSTTAAISARSAATSSGDRATGLDAMMIASPADGPNKVERRECHCVLSRVGPLIRRSGGVGT